MMYEIAEEVKDYRKRKDRRACSRSICYNLNIKYRYGIGVTKFEQLMSKHGLTLLPLRVRVMTTKSCLQSWNYTNLTNGLIINDITQLVVGDITYINIGKDRYYLFCLRDVYSLRIVGYCISKRMRSQEAEVALDMWIKERGAVKLIGCIHHTDGGGQYFSKIYLEKLSNNDILVSVAKTCLENVYAEQINGLIKNRFMPIVGIVKEGEIQNEIDKLIYIYNFERKQEGLGWRTPVEYEEYISRLEIKPEKVLHNHNQVSTE